VEWLEKVFIPKTATQTATPETRLLILDGHGSHTTTDFMYLCFQHNIHLLFLPPYSSHVLQPLDLSIFSSLKRRYRKEIGYLALLTDSSPVGKQNFLISYQKAREEALSISNIKSGWKASGLWPRSMAKPLLSPLLLENSNKLVQTPGHALKGISGTKRLDWTAETSAVIWETPRKAADLISQARLAQSLKASGKATQRQLFRKIAKGFEEKDSLLTDAQLRIQALEAQVKALEPKKRRKVQTSPNSKFAGIEAIQAAQDAAEGIQVISDDSEESDTSASVADCIEVQ
jgi:4-hydroxybenzoate polyprenyltransferase